MLVIDLRPALVADLPARVGGRMTEASDPTMRDASARHTKKAERNVMTVAIAFIIYDVLLCVAIGGPIQRTYVVNDVIWK